MDILAQVEEKFLDTIQGAKGGMEMVDADHQQSILERLPGEQKLVPGGSAGNTVFALARLGIKTAMLGKLGDDDYGRFYRERLLALGGSDQAFIETSEAPTGTCLSLITPDGERTMRSNLAASLLIRPEEAESIDFSQYDIVYIEGYMLYSSILPTVMRKAKKAGCKIGFDLASFEVVRTFREDLPAILREYVDIVLANEEEARELFGPEPSIDEQLKRLSSWCETAAIKLGRKGAMIQSGNEMVKVPAQLVERPIDTTAAGDLWATGFLYGLLNKKPLAEAAWYGALISAEVVKVIGSEIPDSIWTEIRWRMRIR
ncbi:MAG: adenosine kinase [Victivallaceae bacterium]|nr:adenosine kinase [Victivallaceae bacterium]